ncbi:MAG: hypothetical protein U1E05_01960 [Patescibacteria group bacterium]|nr:hypothetical protein [Patescibacteria group bacterium]
MKKPWIAVGVGVAGLLLAPFVAPIFIPWSGINCWHQDINIKTGQARYSRSLWFVKVSERIEDTPLSLALQGETVDVADIRAWHRVNTFSPGVRHSPHYLFHSALHQARQMEMLESLHELTPERRKEVAKSILVAWQRSGRDSCAEELILRLMEEGISNKPDAGDGL